MGSIRFWTTPKFDLTHYSFIFRKPDPLGSELKNSACSRLEVTLYIEIKKGKCAMKASGFQQNIGGTDACMKRIMKGARGWVQLSSNDTFFVDRWFSGVKTAEEANTEGVYFCGSTKKSNKGVFLATLEKLMKECPGGSHIFMKSNPIFHGDIPLMEIGHKYISQKVLGFISAEGSRSTEPGVNYLFRYHDNYSYVSI